MKVSEFTKFLADFPSHEMRFILPDGGGIPVHAHITEIGRVDKNFIDCGGTVRHSSHCTVQIWVAENDEEHRFAPSKLAKVVDMASPLFKGDDLDVEVEYEDFSTSQFPVLDAQVSESVLTFYLGLKRTDCLAKEACGLTEDNSSGCGCGTNCC